MIKTLDYYLFSHFCFPISHASYPIVSRRRDRANARRARCPRLSRKVAARRDASITRIINRTRRKQAILEGTGWVRREICRHDVCMTPLRVYPLTRALALIGPSTCLASSNTPPRSAQHRRTDSGSRSFFSLSFFSKKRAYDCSARYEQQRVVRAATRSSKSQGKRMDNSAR